MREIRLAVFDFDNTLWENLQASEVAVRGFITSLSKDSGLSEDSIKAGIREAFENNNIYEYPDTIRHNPALRAAFPGEDLDVRFAASAELFHDIIRRQSAPYAGIRGMLRRLKLSGVKLACYSESGATALARRMKPMGLDGLFDIVCSSPSAPLPPRHDGEGISLREVSHGLSTRQVEVAGMPHGTSPKDHPQILGMLLEALQARPQETVMVGDHLARDVAMAQKIGVRGFWAKYGRDSIRGLKTSPAVCPYVERMRQQHLDGAHSDVVPHAVLHHPEDLLRHIAGTAERRILPFPRLVPQHARAAQVSMEGSGRLR